MAEVDNPSFETANALTGGFPDAWAIDLTNTLSTSFDWALYASLETLEAFEHSWLGNEDRIAEFVPVTHLEEAAYDSAPESVEDFEEEWLSNEDRQTVFADSDLEEASYDTGTPEDQEDFEEEWLSNEDRKVVFVGVPTDLEEASFDSGTPEEVEDYEEEWNDNEDRKVDFVGVPTDLEEAVFLDGASSETFEEGVYEINIPTSVAIGAEEILDPSHATRITIGAGTYIMTFEIQTQRLNSSAWETQHTVVGTGIHPELDLALSSGFMSVRIETTAYTSGAPNQGFIHWPLLP